MLYIVQMSDFHIGAENSTKEEDEKILELMTKKIQSVVPKGEQLLLCACGDYIDSSPTSDGKLIEDDEIKSRYNIAKEMLLKCVIEPLRTTYKFDIGMCPGNHDITHIKELNAFSQNIIGKDIDCTYAITIEPENVDFVFINSCNSGDHKYGSIDYCELNEVLSSLKQTSCKYFVLHHTLMSMDESDSSSIRQTPQFIKCVDHYSAQAIFHGHTHGQYLVRIGTANCPLIGVGTVLARNYRNVNSQFNLLRCSKGLLINASSYQYHADFEMNPGDAGFRETPIHISTENIFSGDTFSLVYNQVLRRVNAESTLYHLRLMVNSNFSAFQEDITTNFGNVQELQTLDRTYSYLELAEMWEAPELDKNALYFNHGQYFATKEFPNGIDYVLHELEDKRTSSRAVLATVGSKEIAKTEADSFLPSLMSIQFSFDVSQKTLYVTMGLRALEVSRFLKINICEILYLSQKIHEKFAFENINVVIDAFRVQKIENFGCFLRAKLDFEDERDVINSELSCLIYSSNMSVISEKINKIIERIEDKKARTETVIETAGVQNLQKSINIVIEQLTDRQAYKEILVKLAEHVKKLLSLLNDMKKIRASSSEQTSSMSELRNRIQSEYESIIEGFRELLDEKS